MSENKKIPKILIITTNDCAYPGVDTVGQMHLEYPSNTYVVRAATPVMFPEEYYFKCFEKGFDGIVVMACGTDCPYKGAYERFTDRVQRVIKLMKERGINPKRFKMCSICTVCTRPILKEIELMNTILDELGPFDMNKGDPSMTVQTV